MYAFEIIEAKDSPLIAIGLHAGHNIRSELLKYMNLKEDVRLREEDPFTDAWHAVAGNKVYIHQSRFEVDLNRPRELCIYQSPEQSWGLKVWQSALPEEMIQTSLGYYDAFYLAMTTLIEGLLKTHKKLCIFDFHSYNHKRNGAYDGTEAREQNPDINIGTGNIIHSMWRPLIKRFMEDLSHSEVLLGRKLDVRENIRFKGGYFSKWINQYFPERICVLAIEVKKFFMDEWTGVADYVCIEQLGLLFNQSIPGVLEQLKSV